MQTKPLKVSYINIYAKLLLFPIKSYVFIKTSRRILVRNGLTVSAQNIQVQVEAQVQALLYLEQLSQKMATAAAAAGGGGQSLVLSF